MSSYFGSTTSFEIPIPVMISFPWSRFLGRYIYQPYGEYYADTYRYKWQVNNNDRRVGKNERR